MGHRERDGTEWGKKQRKIETRKQRIEREVERVGRSTGTRRELEEERRSDGSQVSSKHQTCWSPSPTLDVGLPSPEAGSSLPKKKCSGK